MKEYQYRCDMMGTKLDVSLISETDPYLLYAEIEALGKAYETRFSRFLSNSELSILNLSKQQMVSETFWQVFTEAEGLYKLTNGVFNPLLSPKFLGYVRDFNTHSQSFTVPEETTFNSDFSAIETDNSTRTIKLKVDQEVDFGGFLKGFVAQEMSKIIKHLSGSIINLGGDIVTQGRDEHNKNFVFEIFHPLDSQKNINISLRNGALATSGTYKRRWGNHHHIMNSKTESSANTDLISASIIHANASKADALATVAISLGSQQAVQFLHKFGCDHFLIRNDGEILASSNQHSFSFTL